LVTRKPWLDGLPFGLPENFDYGVMRTASDAVSFMGTLPNRDRGRAAVGLHKHRHVVGHRVAHAGMMAAWDHDHEEMHKAFGGLLRLADALRDVAPPITRTKRLRVWRGIIVDKGNPSDAVIGLSWTRNRDVACWFAMRWHGRNPALRPFVFEMIVEPPEIIAFHNGRSEFEAIIHPTAIDADFTCWIEGENSSVDQLDGRAPDAAVERWRRSFERYEHDKNTQNATRLAALIVAPAVSSASKLGAGKLGE
jgi:hypothetical protein